METKTTETVETTRIAMSKVELLKALGLPQDADVYVEVPGGGDWSNCELNIDNDVPLKITYKKRIVKPSDCPTTPLVGSGKMLYLGTVSSVRGKIYSAYADVEAGIYNLVPRGAKRPTGGYQDLQWICSAKDVRVDKFNELLKAPYKPCGPGI